ncbi:multiheme c-type cytochrome [Shewanella aestuarii]|uniref:Outer membrane cytochrome MtrC/MtrF-like domain-containing protein n=1 Tax=Shewanella aestuarii TaxID=1028752 RepID=A0A6G9QHC8_9GAMM|nr:cytochrome c3 family protein [Shewanella aestuarii]QIR13475.1 hypothetical protein HBH39_02305 [Shewanella aestuarii]
MMKMNLCKIAFLVATAMGVAACGSDGKDGQDGAPGIPGEPGPGPTPPTVETSTVTNVEMINHMIEDGKVTIEFGITNEDGIAITGLKDASVYLAAMTENGIQRSRDGSVGGSATVGGNSPTEGASISLLDNGNYQFVAPMAAVKADTEGLIRLQVGGGDIAQSPYLIIDKPEMTHTTTTETCYSCHVDYATSDLRHSRYVALNTDGQVDFVGGCMVCHNNVPRDIAEDGSSLNTGGYAKNTMQKLGHVNHQKFEKDFTPANCYTCHAEPVMNTSIAGNGCTDCHTGSSATKVQNFYAANDDFDVRALHANAAGITERKEMRENFYTETSAVYFDETLEFTDHKDVSWVGGYCVDVKLFDNSGETPVQLNIGEMYEAHTITYAGAYVNAYDNETDSIVARVIGHGTEGYVEREDGTRSVCYGQLLNGPGSGYENAHLTTSSRVTLADANWQDDDGKFGVSLTGFSEVVDNTFTPIDKPFSRRHNVDAQSCTTCHTNETNYHKNGSYNNGGESCIACHNNGQDRRAGNSAPGFGPMVHSMHWGVGSGKGTDDANSASELNADNCVSCHSTGINLNAIPNRYMLSRAYNGGVSGVMTSPIMANCFACHDGAQALSHMEQNGGELNVPKTLDWFTQPTAESCATCHAEGRSFGIEKYHNFER